MNKPTDLVEIDPELKTAFAEIVSILRQEFKKTGNPLPKAEIKNRMSADTKPYFDEIRKKGIATDQFYVTIKGLMLSEHKNTMDDEDRLHHLNWCLGLHEAVAGQFVADRDLLLKAPDLMAQLVSDGTMESERLASYLQMCVEKTLQMKINHGKISETYAQVEGGIRQILGELPSPKSNFTKSVKDFSDLQDIVEKDDTLRCKHCGSTNVNTGLGKHKNTTKCNNCNKSF